MTNQIGIYDHSTGEQIVRDMTPQELAERESEVAVWLAAKQAKEQAEAEATAKRAAALAKLESLGLDEDDLKALGL